MKILKKILFGILVLIVLVLLTALFVKRDFALEKQVVINRSSSAVFDYVKHIRNQDQYNPWSLMDPGMTKTYRGTDGTVGFVAGWESDKSGGPGKGEQTITKITAGRRVDVELHFIKPLESVSPAYFVTDSIAPAQTKVSWGMSGKMAYPFNIIRIFWSVDDMMGKELEKGLAGMKAIMEKQ